MKIVLFVLLAILLGGGVFVATLPMSMAADFASKNILDFSYTKASGSVWDGKLNEVTAGDQAIGDLGVKMDFGAIFTGKVAGKLALTRDGFTGETAIAYPFGGGVLELSNLKLSGKAGLVPGMPQIVRSGGGDFALNIENL